jgi:methyl-accepting chemotaxis protein
MELKEIENTFKKVTDGDLTARIDENKAGPELKSLAQMMNRTLDKYAEAAELKRRADRMIQYNPMAIAILRKDKSRIHINKAYETTWRGTREELMKKKLYDFDITVLSGEHFYACYETKKLAITECLVKWPDGVKKYLTLNAIPILDKKGEVDGAFYIWVDYTDLHEKMDAVKKVEQRVDRIIQENPYPLFTIDTQLNIKISNQAFLKLTGISKERASSLSMKDFKYIKNKGESVEATIKSKKRSQGESVIEFPAGAFILEWYYTFLWSSMISPTAGRKKRKSSS